MTIDRLLPMLYIIADYSESYRTKLLTIFLPTPTFHNTTLLLVQNPMIVCTLSELPHLALSVSCTPPSHSQ